MPKKRKEKQDLSTLGMDELIKNLQKKHGQGSIIRFSDKPPKVDVISSGSVRLDDALGIGGLPRGRIVEFYGSPQGGKCLPGSTYIATAQGLMTIHEILNGQGLEFEPKSEGVVEQKLHLLNSFETYEETKCITFNGVKPLLRLTTKSGHVIDSTYNHPHLVFDLYDKLVWKESEKLTVGQYLVCPRRNNFMVSKQRVNIEDIFYNLGMSANDGIEPNIPDRIKQSFYSLQGLVYGVISQQVRSFPKNLLAEFIKGYVDYTGKLKNGTLVMVNPQREVLYQLKLILQIYFGIITHLSQVMTGTGTAWELKVQTSDLPLFYNRIGTARRLNDTEYMKILNDIPDEQDPDVNKDEDPIIAVLNGERYRYYSRINVPVAILRRNYFYDQIVSVEEISPAYTYDFEMAESHSFVANGVVTHNTTVALHCIAEYQRMVAKAGKTEEIAVFIDAENALDINLARKVGVDINRMILSQPDYGEQGLAILEDLIGTKKVGIAVVDSVAALTPKAEIEGEMTDQHMGLQARMMGKGIRKITAIASKSNTLVIFINQIRKKIGIMFGSPDTTPGGEALKFFASVRLDIRPIGQIKHKERIIGNEVKIKVVKNKLAPPYKTIETSIIYGKGFVKEMELLDDALELDVVEQSKATLLYKEQPFAKGKMAAVEVLKKDRKLFSSILQDVRKAQEEARAHED